MGTTEKRALYDRKGLPSQRPDRCRVAAGETADTSPTACFFDSQGVKSVKSVKSAERDNQYPGQVDAPRPRERGSGKFHDRF